MDSSDVNNELIERLLKSNQFKNEQADSTASEQLGDAPFNFTPEQLEMLANVSINLTLLLK